MKTYNLCILGFGSIGRALVALLLEKRQELQTRYAIDWRLTGLATRRLGWIADPAGLDAQGLLRGETFDAKTRKEENVQDWLERAKADVLFELSSLNVETGEPAISHLRAALERGAYAITANKGPVVHAHAELQEMARHHHTRFMYEGAVMAGAPIFALFRDALPASRLLTFRGLLNSTSNVIITEMEDGKTFAEAVQVAQKMGITETDPSNDVDGWDATVKLCAISTVLMDIPLKPQQVVRESIRGLSSELLQAANTQNKTYRSVGRLERFADGIKASVSPELLDRSDPFATASPASLISHFELDVIPGLTMILHAPSDSDMPRTVAYDVLADWLRALDC
jgi:homoserine dehydrogenase